MKFFEVCIVPSAGFLGPDAGYSYGLRDGNLTEVGIVDAYVRALADELDDAAVRHRVLDATRKKPGVAEDERHKTVLGCTLVLSCRIASGQGGKSWTHYGTPDALPVAKLIAESMGQWGQLYVSHAHTRSNPLLQADDPLLTVTGSAGVQIAPFSIDAPDALVYASKLEQLGRDVGRTIADYIISQNMAAKIKPSR